MANSKQWFPHDYNARNTDHTEDLIEEYGSMGYGEYWILVEMMHEDEKSTIELTDRFYKKRAKAAGLSIEEYKKFIEDCCNRLGIFDHQDGFITKERVYENKDKRQQIRQKRSEAGKRGAEVTNSANAEKKAANADLKSGKKAAKTQNERQNAAQTDRQTDNTDNTDIDKVIEKEDSSFSEEDRKKFKTFQDWMNKFTPAVAKMKKPFTIAEYIKLLELQIPKAKIAHYLEEIENKPKYQKDYSSPYLCVKNWHKRDKEQRL